MLTRIRAHLPSYRRALRRRRRTLVILLLAMLAAIVVPSALPAGIRGTTVMVAAADLPAGTVLTREHLREVQVAAELVPANAAGSADAVLGRTTAIALQEGTPLLPSALDGDERVHVPSGQALLAVSAPVQLHQRLKPGAALEVHHSTADPASPGRTPATVVEVAEASGDSVAGFTGTGDDVVVLVLVDREDAAEVAHATREGWSMLSIVG